MDFYIDVEIMKARKALSKAIDSMDLPVGVICLLLTEVSSMLNQEFDHVIKEAEAQKAREEQVAVVEENVVD